MRTVQLTPGEQEWASWAFMRLAQDRPDMLGESDYDAQRRRLSVHSSRALAEAAQILEREGPAVLDGLAEHNMGLDVDGLALGRATVLMERSRLELGLKSLIRFFSTQAGLEDAVR